MSAGPRVDEAVLNARKAVTTDIFKIARGSPAAGRTLADLQVRRRTGATVLAVARGERPTPNPHPGKLLVTEDDLVLVGSTPRSSSIYWAGRVRGS